MTEFLTPTHIGNRALQHCGAEMMDNTLGFTEDSKAAREVSFCYGKLRRAELRRNVWRFAIRRAVLRAIDTTTLLLTPALYVDSTTYFVGSIVLDESNNAWISKIPNNLANQLQNSPNAWEPYFGTLTVSAYDSTTAYFAGELVYTAPGDGTNRVFVSLESANEDNPATATAWASTSTYMKNTVVTRSSVAYMSLIDLNTGNDPASTTVAAWASGTTYSAAAKATGTDGLIYTSIAGSNVGHDPVADATHIYWTTANVLSPWTTSFVGGTGSLKWRQIGGSEFPNGVTVAPISLVYPIGSGPASQSTTRNVFRLPAGYLRMAPADPKAGSNSNLGAPSGLTYNDWNEEGNFITSSQSDPIPLRFGADVTDVTAMDDLFCEGLAARVALEVCEPLTQSITKLGAIGKVYDKFMTEARTVNAIEVGSEEPPMDDYLAVRY